jgi:hypothetical protein
MAIFNKTKIPALIDVLPELGEAIRIRERIQAECSSMKLQAAKLRADISQGKVNDGRNLRVEAILSGNPTPVEPEPDLLRLNAMLRRITDLEAAAEAQWRKINDLERKASVMVCDALRERHDQMARSILERIIEAHELNIQLVALIDQVQGQGASTTSMPSLWIDRVLGNPRDRDSGLGYSLRDAKEKGFLKVVPKEFV